MKRLAVAALCLVAGATFFVPFPAHPAATMAVQGSATATLTVHAHVVRNCSITAAPIDFGNYDPLVVNKTQPLDAQGAITVTCTKGTDAKVDLDDGQNASGTTRRLGGPGPPTEALDYELYQDTGRTVAWRSGSAGLTIGAPLITAAGAGPFMIWIYGRVPGGQNVVPGDYDDTITATIIF